MSGVRKRVDVPADLMLCLSPRSVLASPLCSGTLDLRRMSTVTEAGQAQKGQVASQSVLIFALQASEHADPST